MNVLVIAAHPDDEVLGVGASIARHSAEGDQVDVVILGQGALSRGATDAVKQQALDLERQARDVGKLLGAAVHLEHFPDQRFDMVPIAEIADAVGRHVNRTRASIVYTHHHGDLNSDHRRTCEATMIAARAMPGCPVREFYMWETLSSTEWSPKSEPFVPTYYRDVAKYLEMKQRALGLYLGEIREYPHPRSSAGVEILARQRGLEVGLVAAEAFVVFRVID